MTDISIDINADLGEFEESLANGTDFELMRYITSANVACGGHAGNEQSMRQTLSGARQLKVAVGRTRAILIPRILDASNRHVLRWKSRVLWAIRSRRWRRLRGPWTCG